MNRRRRSRASWWPTAALTAAAAVLCGLPATGGTTHPYYRSRPAVLPSPRPAFDSLCRIDLREVHVDPYPAHPGDLRQYNDLFDARAAAIVDRAAVGIQASTDLLEPHDVASSVRLLKGKALAAMAYPEFFPASAFPPDDFRSTLRPQDFVDDAIMQAAPGWAGTVGPMWRNFEDMIQRKAGHADYDMTQMFLIPLAYRYYDELSKQAREHLIWSLLGRGVVHRINRPDTLTSGGTPDDWARIGYIIPGRGTPAGTALPITHKSLYETENHILMILTARYLTNQLLYQRDPAPRHDNRRNGDENRPHNTNVLLSLLRNILRGDFSEYNAKPYQMQTRFALLNLATFAYESEVRLAARMVLDYVSARFAVTSNDLRRMLPFRRRNEPPRRSILAEWEGPEECPAAHAARCKNAPDPCAPDPGPTCPLEPGPAPYPGIMDVGLIDWQLGADPLTLSFALQAGNTRALEGRYLRCPLPEAPSCLRCPVRPWEWAINHDGVELTVEALTDYRLPPSIHDLIVNDGHRRFYQKLHRINRPEETGGHRNCDSWEINAGSPSYLITAGGTPCDYAIDPRSLAITFQAGEQRQQKGFAVTTSFMPTGAAAGFTLQGAHELIQFSNASEDREGVANYGVAPDLAFGHAMYLPKWVTSVTGPLPERGFVFVDKGSRNGPGFYLAIYHEHGFGLLEAFDTWLHPGLSFEEFKQSVRARNAAFRLQDNVETEYATQNGNRVRLVAWNNGQRLSVENGAQVLGIDHYGDGDPKDRIGDAGNVVDRTLNGTILNSSQEAVVEIRNPALGTTIVLDLSDKWNPRRTSESGEVEEGGSNHEVWLDFDWVHQSEGDFYRPYKTLSAAVAGVAAGGVVKIVPGSIREPIRIAKPMKLVAPIGGVRIGR